MPDLGMMDADPLADLDGWQAMLDRHRDLFAPLAPGTAIGVVPRAVADAPPGDMLVWEGRGGRVVAGRRAFSGFADAGVDLLFVAEPAALATVHQRLEDRPLGAMKLAVREGGILLYVMKPKSRLLDDGFEDFLEHLGLAFLGACR